MNALGAITSEVFSWVLQTTWQAAVLAGLILLAQRLFRKRLSRRGDTACGSCLWSG